MTLSLLAYQKRKHFTPLLLVIPSAFWIMGCGGSQRAQNPEANHLNNVGAICEEYKKEKNVYPSSLEELQQWAINNGKGQESDFKSTRDKEAYVLEPMARGGAATTKGGPVLIREATGQKGLKFVYAGVRAEEMGDSSLDYIRGTSAGMIKAKK
jgi:hypothetical protein